MARQGKMKLGMSMRGLGDHPAAWRHPAVPADGTRRFEHDAQIEQMAERGRFDIPDRALPRTSVAQRRGAFSTHRGKG